MRSQAHKGYDRVRIYVPSLGSMRLYLAPSDEELLTFLKRLSANQKCNISVVARVLMARGLGVPQSELAEAIKRLSELHGCGLDSACGFLMRIQVLRLKELAGPPRTSRRNAIRTAIRRLPPYWAPWHRRIVRRHKYHRGWAVNSLRQMMPLYPAASSSAGQR